MAESLTKKEFKKLSLNEKYRRLKRGGEFIGSRMFDSYHVHLFFIEEFYVEVWQRLGLSQIYWIEPVNSDRTLHNYLDHIDIQELTEKLR
ncbi:MAG: hypothetical protein ACFB10_07140 [Salibacteraceae bacterium]